MYEPGTELKVTATELGTLALTVCADLLAPSLAIGHDLCGMGVQLILSPSAWAVPPDHDVHATPYGNEWLEPYRELVCLHDVTVIGVSNVGEVRSGPRAGRRCIGRSLAVGPGGELLARGPYDTEALLVVDGMLSSRS